MPDTVFSDEEVGLGNPEVFQDEEVGVASPEQAQAAIATAAQAGPAAGRLVTSILGNPLVGMGSEMGREQDFLERSAVGGNVLMEQQNVAQGMASVLGLARKGIQKGIMEPLETAGSELINQLRGATQPQAQLTMQQPPETPPEGLQAEPGKPLISIPRIPMELTAPMLSALLPADVKRAIEEREGQIVSGTTTPGMALTLPVGGTRAGQALFAAGSALEIPESMKEIQQAQNWPQAASAITGLAGNVAIAVGAGRESVFPRRVGAGAGERISNARSLEEAATVHGDVRTQQPSAGALPEQEGGPGVQPQAEGRLAKETQVSLGELNPRESRELNDLVAKEAAAFEGQAPNLTAEQHARLRQLIQRMRNIAEEVRTGAKPLAYEELERSAIDQVESAGAGVDVVDDVDPNVPFSGGKIMFLGADGRVKIVRGALRRELARILPDQRAPLVQAAIGEELNHLAVHDTVGAEGAKAFWELMTPLEQALHMRRYTGYWTMAEHLKAGGPQFSPTELGYEALNSFQKRLQRMPLQEAIGVARKERWTIKTVDALANALYKAREALGTKASRAQRAIMDDVLNKVNHIRSALGQPGAYRQPEKELTPEEVANRVGGWRFEGRKEGYKMGEVDVPPSLRFTGVEAGKRTTIHIPADAAPHEIAQRLLAKSREFGVSEPVAKRVKAGIRPEDVQITVSSEQTQFDAATGKTYRQPGYVQVDEIHPEMGNTFSTSPEEMNRAGFEMPSTPSLLNLPRGRYRLPDALNRLDQAGIEHLIEREPQGPAAYRKPGEEEGGGDIIPKDLSKALFKAWKAAGPHDPMFENMRWNAKDIIADLAVRPESEWAIPEGLKDQVHAWFARQRDKPWDRVKIIDDSLELMHAALSADHEMAIRAEEIGDFENRNEFLRLVAKNEFAIKKMQALKADVRQMYRTPPEDYSPAAYRKPKKGKPGEQPEMFPGITGMGVPGEENVPRGTAEEHGALPRITGTALEDAMAKHVATEGRPSFREFLGWVERNAGHTKPDQLRTMWQDQVWLQLVTAPAERLAQLRKELQLESKVGTRTISEAPPPTRPEEVVEGTARTREIGRKFQVKAQKYRSNVISAIGRKLIEESLPRTKSLTRDAVTLDDIDFGSDRSKEGAYREIREDELNPVSLYRILSDAARASKREAVSITRRVVALLNRSSNAVELVDAYPYGEAGERKIRVSDPIQVTGARERPHRELDQSFLRQYRPIASILLDEPVQNFHQRFESVSDYMDAIGREASGRERVAEWAWAGEPEEFVSPEEAPFGARPKDVLEEEPQIRGGMFAGGPGKPETQAVVGVIRGELERAAGVDMTPAEALAVLDHVLDEVGKIETPADMSDAFAALVERGKTRKLRGRDFQVISALKKAADQIQRKYAEVDLTPDQAYAQALDEFYQILSKNEGSEDYIQQALGRFTRSAPETRGIPAPAVPGAPERVTGVSRELTMRSRRPPTSVEGLPPGVPPERTEARPAPPTPPEMLPPQAQAAVEQRAAKEFPTTEKAPIGIAAPSGKEAVYYPPLDFIVQGQNRYLRPPLAPEVDPRPAAWRRITQRGQEEWARKGQEFKAMATRRDVKKELAKTRDVVHNDAVVLGDQADKYVRTFANQSKEHPQGDIRILKSAPALIAAKFTRNFLPSLIKLADNGIVQGNNLLQSKNPANWFKGRAKLRAAEELKESAQWAYDNWTNTHLHDTAHAMVQVLDEQYAREIAAGKQLRYRENYYPGRYDGTFWNDTMISFPGIGRLSVLGRNWRLPKTFDNMWTAIAHEEGPYIPATLDGASIIGSRVRQGMESINRKAWQSGLFDLRDPVSKLPIVRRPVKIDNDYRVPGPDGANYELVKVGAELLGVRKGFVNTIEALTQPSFFQKHAIGRAGVEWSQRLKHTLLSVDLFHFFRTGYYGIAAQRALVPGYNRGLLAIEYDARGLERAVENGVVTPKEAQWVTEPLQINIGEGKTREMTRRQILNIAVQNGFNIGRLQDAIYKDMMRNIPWLTTYNKFLFDKFTRGLMAETFVRNFERYNKAHPNLDPDVLLRDVVKDTNAFFASMGRQGWIKSETFRDLSRLAFLAPQWVEGLLRKEFGFYGRLGAAPLRAAGFNVGRAKELPHMGMLGSAMGSGLGFMLVLTQAMNMFTRGHPTWENPEKEHKMDAFIPLPGGSGVWLSPLSVFNEFLHDMVRYSYTKPKVYDAIQQIGDNKMGLYSRALMVLASGKTPYGAVITTTPGVLKETAKALAPVPITLGAPLRSLGHVLAPSLVRPPPPGATARQSFSSLGFKTEAMRTPEWEIHRMAQDFMKKEGLKKESGWVSMPTDEPSYSKLRAAVEQKDKAGFKSVFDGLMKTHTEGDILEAMRNWANAPFTGNSRAEGAFIGSLTKKEMDQIYNKAVQHRMDLYLNFVDMYIHKP